MTDAELKRVWLDNYRAVPTALQDIKKVEAVATAFNTNIDGGVLKISGKRIAELARKLRMSWEELHQIKRTKISKPADVIKGLLKCFEKGIAEEWITEDIRVYNWMMEEIGYERLQMGGQGRHCGQCAGSLRRSKSLCSCEFFAGKTGRTVFETEQFMFV